jgi:drug/metabolite transporter (DMT)-like permease
MWIVYGLLAMGSLGLMLVLLKQASLQVASATTLMLWLFAIATLGNFLQAVATRQPLKLAGSPLLLVAAAAVLSSIGNVAYQKSISLAPNPGLPVAIEGCKVVVVLAASYFLFDAGLSLSKGVGIGLCLAGVFLIVR